MKLSIIIPCYNEAKNIPLILERFQEVIDRDDIEVILVDNNSSDDSKQVLAELLPKYTFARSIFEPTPGYGQAIVAGLRVAQGEYIGWTHADMQTDPKDPIRALDIIEKLGNPSNIYLKGRRLARPLIDIVFTFGMSVFETIYMGRVLFDINAQPNIFHRNFFANWQNPPGDFALDLYALYLAKQMRFRVIRFNVRFPKRIHGRSTWDTGFASKWKFVKRTLKFSVELKKRLSK
ncbi:glycosyltransferase [Patescibacteria group bacterium]|nr:glycosyltransferase [Patescibacteria group bacterium]